MQTRIRYLFTNFSSLKDNRVQVFFLVFFVLINLILLMSAKPKSVQTSLFGDTYMLHPAYSQASDGQRYWGAALSLAERGQFLIRSDQHIIEHHNSVEDSLKPLSRAGPLPAILFAVPIKLFGFSNAIFFIVAGQCFLLWLMSLATRGIAEPFKANKNLAQALVLFNPNLIGIAHHAQSDLIFAAILTFLLLVISKLIDRPSLASLKNAALIALLAGLLPLARPMGAYCIFLLPFFLFFSLLVRQRFIRIDWRKISALGALATAVTLIILTPWAVRNHAVFGDFGLTQSGAIQAQYYYRALKPYGLPDSTPAVINYLEKHGYDPSCLNSGEPGSGCEKAIRNAYMNLILKAPKTILAQVQITAAIRTLLSGGTRTITDYIGLEPPSEQYDQLMKYNSTTLSKFLKNIYDVNPTYLILFILITAFPFITRGIGLIGLIRAISNPRCHAHLLFHLLIISLLLLLYGLQGWSRFRVPIEPILMVFTAIAFANLGQRETAVSRDSKRPLLDSNKKINL